MASALRRAGSRTAGKRKGVERTAQSRASASFADVDEAVQGITQAPPSQKDELRRRASKQVLQTLQQMRSDGAARLFGSERDSDGALQLQQTAQWQLKTVGIKNPSAIAEQGTERFATLTCTTLQRHLGSQDGLSMLADSGSVFVVIGIGSINPSLFKQIIDKFNQVSPTYKERVLRHEAAHFLLAYLFGLPVTQYSVSIGYEHTDLLESRLEKALTAGRVPSEDVAALGVVAMAGAACEALQYGTCQGQQADLLDLQRVLDRAEERMSDKEQQNATVWATYTAAMLLNKHSDAHERLVECLRANKTVSECFQAIEGA